MGILSVLIFAIFCIFFLVTLVLSAWRWRWLNIVVMLFLFPTAVAFLIMFANVMQKNYDQRGKLDKVTRTLEKAEEDKRMNLMGSKEANQWTKDSVLRMTHRLEEAELGRGRVWRDCQPGTVNGTQIEVTTFRAGTLNADGTEATVLPNNIQTPSLVYVFTQSGQTAAGGVPQTYLGEFRINAATDTTATLEPNLVLDAAEVAESTSFPWTLYELMPADVHLPFEAAEEAEETELALDQKRQLLMTKYLTPESMNMDADSPEYIKMIDSYWLDGMPLGEITALPGYENFTPTDDEIWIKVEVLKDFEIDVDADIDITSMLESESFKNFNDRGQAQNPDLKFGSPIQLKKGETYLFDKKSALDGYLETSGNAYQSLVDGGFVKETGRIYLRTLNDYGSAYREVTLALDLLARELGVQQHHNAELTISTKLAADEIGHRVNERDGHETDQANLTKDIETLDTAIAAQTKSLNDTRDRLAQLDAEIEKATVEFARLEALWAEQAEEKTRAATSPASFTR